ncbi:hypothetical protein FW755_06260 [Lonepinella koalarum]|uniref:PTS transporter subunit EIIB n=1 Tax=Lonepinella koalarum TaxID=53417 RepID=UPI0011E467A2|nr:PTS glucose/sucrose transporter subunit IIB [Lonepinella koalarum]TYG34713.1 hypothetical protein FW755_06260 [Lonepinella koalarum]
MRFFSKKEESLSPYIEEKAVAFLNALGGKENIQEITACITRLRLKLVDLAVVDENQLTQLGSKGNIVVGENELHIVLGKQASEISESIKANLGTVDL